MFESTKSSFTFEWRALAGLKRIFHFPSSKKKKEDLTKWHFACKWIAHVLGGADLVVGESGQIIVVKISDLQKSKHCENLVENSWLVSTTAANQCSMLSLLAVFDANDLGKDIEQWSASQAEDLARLLLLQRQSGNEYGSAKFNQKSFGWSLALDSEKKLPKFSSEEELFINVDIEFGIGSCNAQG